MTLPHELRIRVRYSETDPMGVVHHSNYVIWLEEGRTALMRDLGVPYEEVERSGYAMGVRKMDLRYRHPGRYGDVVLVRTDVRQLKNASIQFGYEVVRERDGRVLLTGTVETVCVQGDTLRPVVTPEHLRRPLLAALGAAAR